MTFEPNPDILREMGSLKTEQCLVGFAAETDDLVRNARKKLEEKNLDFIVANDVTESDAGFGAETNRISIVDRTGNIEEVPLCSKLEAAHRVLDRVAQWMREHGRIA